MTRDSTDDPREARPLLKVFRLGEEPGDDLSGCTTAEERLRILRDLTERAWQLTGRPIPSYRRDQTPIRVHRVR